LDFKEILQLLKISTTAEEIDKERTEIAEWIPVVQTMFDYDQNSKYHQYDLWMHSIHTVLGLPRDLDDDMLYLAALLHDIGKPECRCKGKREDDTDSHYYGHPDVSKKIVSEQVIPYILCEKNYHISFEDLNRLIYYVEYHDDRVSLRRKHLKRHLQMVSMETFKKLMLLEVADAKAHVIYPIIQERIDICSTWHTDYADEIQKKLNEEK